MNQKKSFSLTLERKKNLTGLLFVMPFIIGFILLFLSPLVESVIYTFNKLTFREVGGFDMTFVGLNNYVFAFTKDAQFTRVLVENLTGIFSKLPFIIFFSYFIAMILNQRFKGRLLVRIIFFLPVILGSSVILKMEQSDFMMSVLGSSGDSTAPTATSLLVNILTQSNIPAAFLNYIIGAIEQSASIIKESSIQILIFLSSLQSISGTLYEASNVEGATAWENFWKITFPLMLPTMLVNIVYTIIDSYNGKINGVVEYTNYMAVIGNGYGLATTMNWIYLFSICCILLIVFAVFSRKSLMME